MRKPNPPARRCEHNLEIYTCRLCRDAGVPFAGTALCTHDRRKTVCKECKGGNICLHNRQRSQCSVCHPHSVYKMYMIRAERRGLSFELSFDQFTDLIRQTCHYCGEYPTPTNGITIGIDRIKNAVGYIAGNVVTCCGPCNTLKGCLSYFNFITQCRKVADHAT